MTYKPPQADSPESKDHLCTLQSCHGAVVAPLSDVPQEGSSVFSLFSLIKLHLASLPLASSYSRVAVSSVFCAQNICFSAQTRGAPLTVVLVMAIYLFILFILFIYFFPSTFVFATDYKRFSDMSDIYISTDVLCTNIYLFFRTHDRRLRILPCILSVNWP